MRTLVLVLPLLLVGCSLFDSDEEDAVACLTVEVQHELAVQLPDGTPAEGVRLTATNERTGATYGPCDGAQTGVGCAASTQPGRYVIYTDGLDASRGSDDVTVRGIQGDLAFEAAFQFRQGACHVEKVAGPDSATLR